MQDAIARARRLRVTSHRLCSHSDALRLVFRAACRRYRPIKGASDAPDPELQARITRTLNKTRRGGLPAPIDGKLYAGPGSLEPCAGCGDKVARSETEYEVEIGETVTFRFHQACYNAWRTFPAPN